MSENGLGSPIWQLHWQRFSERNPHSYVLQQALGRLSGSSSGGAHPIRTHGETDPER